MKNIQHFEDFINESELIKFNEEFDGTGLIIKGRTQIDNNEIEEVLDDLGYHGEWNYREGYWFLPEDEETLDSLEIELQKEFNKRDINAYFEDQFN